MKRTIIITGIVVVLSSLALFLFLKITADKKEQALSLTRVMKGTFEIAVEETGELMAEHALEIRGPDIVRNRSFRTAAIRITDLVPEGTIVEKGDYIASLDRSMFDNTLKDEINNLNRLQEEFDMKILDTAVTLSTLRDDIRNQVFANSEAQIVLEQSIYEPPAVQRQAELEVDRMRRFLEQKQRIYLLRLSQASSDLRIMKLNLDWQRRKVNDLREVLAQFTVTSPAGGMVIYRKDRTGVKIRTGSMMNPVDPVIATLPDLSSLLSSVYGSEIEINRIRTGQEVKVRTDAYREKVYKGTIAGIANIGEQIPNSDSKVFEVLIRLEDIDPLLRPAMTTDNKIIIRTYNNVMYIPSASVHAGPDNIPFVYTRGGTRQVVLLGEANDDYVIVEKGLDEDTSIYLSIPSRAEKFSLAGQELIPEILERQKVKRMDDLPESHGDDLLASHTNISRN